MSHFITPFYYGVSNTATSIIVIAILFNGTNFVLLKFWVAILVHPSHNILRCIRISDVRVSDSVIFTLVQLYHQKYWILTHLNNFQVLYHDNLYNFLFDHIRVYQTCLVLQLFLTPNQLDTI